jgi:hypothetical protein
VAILQQRHEEADRIARLDAQVREPDAHLQDLGGRG